MGRNQLERIGKNIARTLDLPDPASFGSRAFCTTEGKVPRASSRPKTKTKQSSR